jgi:hypothetical protein
VAGQFDELTYVDGPVALTEEVKRGRVRLRRPRVEVLGDSDEAHGVGVSASTL